MTAKRLLAFLGAVALIVGAVFLRDALDNRSTDATGTTDKPTTGRATVICSTEFAFVCKALDTDKFTVTIEPAGITLDALAKAGAEPPDAWITLDPFPAMVEDTRARAPLALLSPDVTVIASDVPQLAVAKGRADAFATGCSGQRSWSCAGASAGQPWTTLEPGAAAGNVLPGLTNPSNEALGLLSFANAVAGYFASADLDAGSWTDTGFRSWYRNVSSSVAVAPTGATPLDTLLVRQTQINVAATTQSQSGAAPETSKTAFTVFSVEPVVPINAVVATFSPRGKNVVAPITSDLVAGGWSRASDPEPALPAGTFVALRKLWEDSN